VPHVRRAHFLEEHLADDRTDLEQHDVRPNAFAPNGVVVTADAGTPVAMMASPAHRTTTILRPIRLLRFPLEEHAPERPGPAVFGATVGWMNDDADLELAMTFSEIARILIAEADPPATLQRIVSLAVKTIEGCEHAGISVVVGKTVTSPASSDEVPAIVDRLQSETGEGPCVDAIREHQVFQTGNLSAERRWPTFTPRAVAESGVESVLSMRLFANETLGALNLYSTKIDAFDDRDVAVATVFAAHAAVAWSTSRTIENLKGGLVTRQLIGQAVGLLMVRQNMTESDALDSLKRASQRLNIKLRQVAERIVYPEGGPPAHSVD